MDANEYQRLAARTLLVRPDFEITDDQVMMVWNAMGLAGEAGEVANLVKKGIFHQHDSDLGKRAENNAKIVEELGDVLWYAAAICTKLGISVEWVMACNVLKLEKRYPEGYSAEASMAREVGDGN